MGKRLTEEDKSMKSFTIENDRHKMYVQLTNKIRLYYFDDKRQNIHLIESELWGKFNNVNGTKYDLFNWNICQTSGKENFTNKTDVQYIDGDCSFDFLELNVYGPKTLEAEGIF